MIQSMQPANRWCAAIATSLMVFGALIVSAPARSAEPARAYELVSPPSKGGADILADSTRVRAAPDGSAVQFSSLGGFGDVLGTGVAVDYMANRSGASSKQGNGWDTHALTPAQGAGATKSGAQSFDPRFLGEFSADFTQGVFLALSPLTPEAGVEKVLNLYRRDDLMTPGGGSYSLVSSCPGCGSLSFPRPFTSMQIPGLADAAADFRSVLFSSVYPLTADSTADGLLTPNVYQWDSGRVRLVSRVPPPGEKMCDDTGGTPCVPAARAIPGAAQTVDFYTGNTLSSDGMRAIFTDNAATFGAPEGDVYQRVNGTTTHKVNASERASPDPSSQPARFEAASEDGTRVFFTSPEALVDEHPAVSGLALYLYDSTRPEGRRLRLLSVDGEDEDSASVRGVIGASDDGRTVYFIAAGQMVDGKPLLDARNGVYRWHDDGTGDGSIDYIGALSDQSTDLGLNIPTHWVLIPLAARVSPDGNTLVFTAKSGAGLAGEDHGTTCASGFEVGVGACAALYVYRAATRELRCASCNPSGAAATSDAYLQVRFGTGGATTTQHLSRALSDDGRFVFFTTKEALVPQDTNGKADAYMFDTVERRHQILSSGRSSVHSYFMDASASGSDAFILTRERLVGWDRDDNYDLYDVRVGGGVREPERPSPPCVTDGCQPTPSGAPDGDGVAPSSSTTSRGNSDERIVPRKAVRRTACRRGRERRRVRGRVRCVRRKATRRAPRGRRGATERSGK